MKMFAERNPVIIGAAGAILTAAAVLGALQYDRLPIFTQQRSYSAYFAEAGGLLPNSEVWVAGYKMGNVNSVTLDGAKVLVTFRVGNDVQLGDHTEAAIKTQNLLGTKYVEVTPRGQGALDQPIPVSRTRSAYQLPDALGDLATTISGLDTQQLSQSLATLAHTLQDTPPDLKAAVDGVARFSRTLNARDDQLRNLLADANKVTEVLARRSEQIVGLVGDTNGLLAELRSQSTALEEISGNISAVSRQLSAVIADNRDQLRPALDKLNTVLTILDTRKERIQHSIKLLNSYALSLGESLSSGPFFKAYIVNLLPGQFLQPFVDAAFSDLGLDPNVLLPSQLNDPQTGQAATPALPSPYPRTGQGGPPRLTLPDAITGNPDDPRYPYREPPPAPPPGGPPPGPPALDPSAPAAPVPAPPLAPAPGGGPPSTGDQP